MSEKITFGPTIDDLKKIMEQDKERIKRSKNNQGSKNITFFQDLEMTENTEFNFTNIRKVLDLNSFEKNKAVLLVGEVQSGKTKNMIKMLEYVLNENDFDDVFWICGTNNNLLSQSISRLKSDDNFDLDKFEIGYIEYLKTREDAVKLRSELETRRKVIAVSLKNKLQLENLNKGINFADTICSKRNLLIIDDECDFMSLSQENNLNEIKANHKLLMNLLNNKVYNKTIYVGVTATPYGNFNKERSMDLFPKEVVLLNRSKTKYTGLEWFNKNSEQIYIDLKTEKKDSNENTIELALINHAFSIYRDPMNFSEMLINIELDKTNHFNYRTKVQTACRKWMKMYSNSLNEFKGKIKESLETLKHDVEEVDFDKFATILEQIYKDKIWILNGDFNSEEKYESGKQNAIVIGGVMVSRGYTFENLTTQIMINAPAAENKINIGVLLQRARWFGYRLKNKDKIRIILNSKIIAAFKEAESAQAELFHFLNNDGICSNAFQISEQLESVSNQFKYLEVK